MPALLSKTRFVLHSFNSRSTKSFEKVVINNGLDVFK